MKQSPDMQKLEQMLRSSVLVAGGFMGNDVRVVTEIIEADADLLDDCLNGGLIQWIVDYNFFGVKKYPKIKTRARKKPDLREQSEIDKTVAVDIGVPVGKNYFYKTYGIPKPDASEDIIAPKIRKESE